MKLKEEFITHETDGEQIMVCAGTSFNGIVKSNKTAAFIVDCLKTDTTSAKIIEKMLVQYNVSKETITADVKKIIDLSLTPEQIADELLNITFSQDDVEVNISREGLVLTLSNMNL